MELNELLELKKFGELKQELVKLQGVDVAQFIETLEQEEQSVVFRILPKETAAEVFVELYSSTQEMLIQSFSSAELQTLLSELFADDTVDIIEEMPAFIAKRIIANADEATRTEINELLGYPDDSAGSIMTTEFVSLKENMTVQQAFARIRQTGIDKETVYTCYVTDARRLLLGIVSVRTLLLADYTQTVGEIMERNVISAVTTEDKEEVAKKFSKYDFIALPVVDAESRLVGIITVDDAMDVIEEEATEDIQRMGALQPIEQPYLKTSVFTHWSSRIVWLLVLMVSGIFSGLIISNYEASFRALPLLVAFIPRLMDTGGNCGAQSSTLIIRALSLDEVRPRDVGKIMLKELCVGILVGLTLAVANVPIMWIFYGSQAAPNIIWLLCATVGLTLVCVAIIAKLLGCSMPILAKKLHLDPALMASPIITTLVDVCAILLYFIIANAVVIPVTLAL